LPFFIIRDVIHDVIDLGRRFGHIYPPDKAIRVHTVSKLQKQGSGRLASKAVAPIFAAFPRIIIGDCGASVFRRDLPRRALTSIAKLY
jgi:hypothetical protein